MIHCLFISHSIIQLFHAIASILLFYAWQTIEGDCGKVVGFVAKLHAILAIFYVSIGSGKMAAIIAHYFGKKMSAKIMSAICAILSAKVYLMGMLAEGVLEVATFAPLCNDSSAFIKHLWLSRLFFGVSLIVNAIFLGFSVFSHQKS